MQWLRKGETNCLSKGSSVAVIVGLDLEGRPNSVMEGKELAMFSSIVGFSNSA